MDTTGTKAFSIAANDSELEYFEWSEIGTLIKNIFNSSDYVIIICTGEVETPSESERKKIIQEYHDSVAGGHQGVRKLHAKIRESFYWPRMGKQIADFVRTCDTCQRKKIRAQETKQPMRGDDGHHNPNMHPTTLIT